MLKGKETSFEKPRYKMPGQSQDAPLRNRRARAAKTCQEVEALSELGNQKTGCANRTGGMSKEARCAQG